MAIKRLAAVAAVLAMVGCAPTKFDAPPGVDEAQFHRDNLECVLLGKRVAGDSMVIGPPLLVAAAVAGHDEEVRKAHDECMLGKAYTVHRDP